MVVYISLSEKERNSFFNKLKSKINGTWEKFYPSFEISRSMFFNYLSGRYDIPKEIFMKWKKLLRNSKISFSEKEKIKYLKKQIPEIVSDEKLSEILGILNGDGHISNFQYEICVVGDLKEKEYFGYLKNLFESKFKIPFVLRKEKHAFKLRCYSKEVSNFLTSKCGLPKGNKLGKLKIPNVVFKSRELLRSYIRGLYDADGSLFFRRNNEPVVQITSADSLFLNEVKEAIISLDFSVSKGNQRIFLYGKKNVEHFFNEIKPANSKHLKKYRNYLNS